MGNTFVLIGLLFELLGVLLIASSNITIMTLDKFLPNNNKIRFITFIVPLGIMIFIIVLYHILQDHRNWPLIFWLLIILLAIALIPGITLYSKKYSKRVGRVRDEIKNEQLHLQGLFFLVTGFVLQSLGTVLK